MAPSHGPSSGPRSESITTSFLLSNLHCPTCVTTIREVLQDCAHYIKWVSPNVVTSAVTVEHDPAVTIEEMESALEKAGFDVCGVTTTAGDATELDQRPPIMDGSPGEGSTQHISRREPALLRWITPKPASKTPMTRDQQAKVHLQNCEKCRTSKPHGADERRSFDTALPSQASSSAALDKTGNPEQPGKTSSKSFIAGKSDEAPPKARRRATLAVGGMTCAVCVNTITDELSKRDWISKVVVSLVTNSATVEFNDEDKVGQVVEAIEDLGYEATIDTLVNLDEEKSPTQERTVEILLEGIYCEHCPDRVARSLAGFRRQLEIVSQPTEQHPIMKISSVPEAPTFTVRQILAAIEAGDPALTASTHHPPTLEERSKQILHHHQLQLLYRVVLTGIICIPTFIIGIVYMSLVPDKNGSKQYLMAPWASGISRGQISMFIMATPVYFLAADLFHTRALKEIKALWRPPVLHRFYRFGSMNTLMSLGTTIAYVSSVAQLIAAGVNRPLEINNSNFYFDSVVFLTFFLLLGRLIESFSKARAGDAVEMLGKLRPTTAILVEHRGTGKEEDSVVQADLLDFGDIVRVPHGASPPADGIVVLGESNFDESSLTGESRLVKKRVGDEVFSGTVNKDAPISVQITGVAGKSMLDQISVANNQART